MAKPDPKLLAKKAGAYLKDHPDELLRVLRGALGLRLGVPIDALRYLVREFGGGAKAPRDVVIEAAPPGVRLAATVDAMGTPVRATLVVFVEELDVTTRSVEIGTRIAELSLRVLGDGGSPLAGLLKSGALDLSKPGNLVAFLPKKPAVLIEAKDDRLRFDLLKLPALAKNGQVKRALAILTPVFGVRAIKTKDDHLDVHLRASLKGVPDAIAAARAGA